jgi:hypothetical protein
MHTAISSSAEPNKVVPATPFVPLDGQPGVVFVGTSPEPEDNASEYYIFLPAVQR